MRQEHQGLPAGLASVHTHSHYCDGQGDIEEYVTAAIDAGLTAFGASGHSPVPFGCQWAMNLADFATYVVEVRFLAQKYAEKIPILLGLELDYHPGLADFYHRELFSRGLDYVVASVHFVGDSKGRQWAYDESASAFDDQVREAYGGDARPAVEDYYRRLQQMVREASHWSLPVVIGHLDRIVLWNRGDRYFPTDNTWYEGLIADSIGAIADTDCVVEINTSGWEKPCVMSNPNLPILTRAARAGQSVIVSADAHQPDDVAIHFRRALGVLVDAGFTELVVPGRADWSTVPLPIG